MYESCLSRITNPDETASESWVKKSAIPWYVKSHKCWLVLISFCSASVDPTRLVDPRSLNILTSDIISQQRGQKAANRGSNMNKNSGESFVNKLESNFEYS